MKHGWSDFELALVTQGLTEVLLEEWGGPRSPLALQYIQGIIIPDLASCFAKNANLLLNPTFTEILAFKLKSQYAYPASAVNSLAADLIEVVQRINKSPLNQDPKEPWRRIFRLWICGESLPGIEERTGYPLDYLDLLLIRFKKLSSFLRGTRASLLECIENAELQQFGLEQLNFLYQLQSSISAEPLFKERMALEQVALELEAKLQVSDLVAILEIVHTHEGRIEESTLASALPQTADFPGNYQQNLFPTIVDSLIALHFLKKNNAGKLALTEKSAAIIAGFIAPKLLEQIQKAVDANDFARAKEILLKVNPEVLVKVINDIAKNFSRRASFTLLVGIFKQVNRRIDLYLISIFGEYEAAFELLITCLGDQDSLVRAKACEALGHLGNRDAAFRLIQALRDPVPGVKEMAAHALGEIGSTVAVKALLRVAEDYGEGVSVRGRAIEALRKLETGQEAKQKNESLGRGN